MSYEWVDHTSELELRIDASDEAEVYLDAAAAFADLVAPSRELEPRELEVTLEARDRASLLAAWLEEHVYLADTERFVADEIDLVTLSAKHLQARLAGHVGEPRPIVKAVTYHRLSFEQENGRWKATVVLDV